MRNPLVTLLLPLLLCFSSASSLATDADPLARAGVMLEALKVDTPTAQYAETARNFGALVDELRQQGAADEVLVKMRVGGESNASLGRILRKSREDYRALRSNNVGGLGTLAIKNLGKLSQFFVR